MSKENGIAIVIEEIARVALGMVFDEIGHELDLSDTDLLKVREYLEAKLNTEECCRNQKVLQKSKSVAEIKNP